MAPAGPATVERDYQANGLRIHSAVWEQPASNAPPLVLLHGIWDTWRTFAQVAPRLAAYRTVYALDLRGHGDSDKPEAGYRLADYAADLLAVLEQLPAERADLLGFSLGALVGLQLAAGRPARLAHLILVDPPLGQDTTERGYDLTWRYLLDLKQQPLPEVIDELGAMHPGRDAATTEASARALIGAADGPFQAMLAREQTVVDDPALFARVTVPTLVLRADPLVGGALPERGRRRLLAALPNVRFVEFAGSGHLIHAERTDRFVEVVERFLADEQE